MRLPADCKFEARGESPTFLNDLADNIYRSEAYVNDIVIGQQELRVSLHSSLDRELGVSHSDDVSKRSSAITEQCVVPVRTSARINYNIRSDGHLIWGAIQRPLP